MKLYAIKLPEWEDNFFSNEFGYMKIYSNQFPNNDDRDVILEWKFRYEKIEHNYFKSVEDAIEHGNKVYIEFLEQFLIHTYDVSYE